MRQTESNKRQNVLYVVKQEFVIFFGLFDYLVVFVSFFAFFVSIVHHLIFVPVERGLGQHRLAAGISFVVDAVCSGLQGCQSILLDLPIVLTVSQKPGPDRLHGMEHGKRKTRRGAHDGRGTADRLAQQKAVGVGSGHDARKKQIVTRPHSLDNVVNRRIRLDDGVLGIQVLGVKVFNLLLVFRHFLEQV